MAQSSLWWEAGRHENGPLVRPLTPHRDAVPLTVSSRHAVVVSHTQGCKGSVYCQPHAPSMLSVDQCRPRAKANRETALPDNENRSGMLSRPRQSTGGPQSRPALSIRSTEAEVLPGELARALGKLYAQEQGGMERRGRRANG